MGSIEAGRSFSSLEHLTNSIAIHADKVSINKRLVWETFMAQNRRVMMATNNFLVTV